MIVDDVVASLPYGGVDGGEGCPGRGKTIGGRSGGSVQGGRERAGIDSSVDHLHARHLRSRGAVQVDFVTPGDQAAREIGHERLRAPTLRLADGRNKRGDNRDPHRAIGLYARSRGGLTPSAS